MRAIAAAGLLAPAVFIATLGCTRPGAPAPQRAAAARAETTVTAVRRMSADEIERARAGGTPVDTIEVARTRIELRVGETASVLALRPRARDAAGRPVAGFAPAFIVPASPAVASELITLRARAPGEAVLYVEALAREPDTPRPRPSTRVGIIVRP